MVKKELFGMHENRAVYNYILTNQNGNSLTVSEYGGTWISLAYNKKDIILGFDTLQEYENNKIFCGGTVGRFANRISRGKFTINGAEYTLAKNDGNNNLHGGNVGFDKVVWNSEIANENGSEKLRLSYISADLEEGFPGELCVQVDYYITDNDEIIMEEKATTNKTTVCNLTQHAYFNLDGFCDISNHVVCLNADKMIEVDEKLIPTGNVVDVTGSFDLQCPKQMKNFGREKLIVDNKGYDFCYILKGEGFKKACEVQCGNTLMQIHTTKPAMQIYTANWIGGTVGKCGKIYKDNYAICCETSGYPDAPNHQNFPSATLNPNEIYLHKTIFSFSQLGVK